MATVAGSLRNKVLVVDDLTSGDITVTDLVVSGTVTLQGTATTLDSTNTTVTDSIIELNSGLTGSNTKDIGFVFERGSTGNNAAFIWDESADRFTVITTTGTASDNTLSGTVANFQAGSFFGNGANLTSLNASNLSSGTISTNRINQPTNANWWSGGIPIVATDGVMEIGKYIDFHNADTSTADYTARITNSGDHLYATGRLYVNSTQRVFADDYHPNADKWTTARTLTLGGDLTGSVSFDGSANFTLTAAVVNDSHTHDGRYFTETEADARFINTTGDTATGIHEVDGRWHFNPSTNSSYREGIRLNRSTTGWGGAVFGGVRDSIDGITEAWWVARNPSKNLVLSYGTSADSGGLLLTHNNTTMKYKNQRVFMDDYHPNADTLTTARTINGVSFNGSANITVADSTKLPLTGGTMTGELNIHKTNSAGILNLRNTSDSGGNPVAITFSSQGTSGTQVGHIKYTHSNALSYGALESFTFGGTESSTVILADGQFYYKDGIYKKPSSGTGVGTRKDANWDTAYGWGNHASAGYTTNTGTVTSIATGAGLDGTFTTSGTITLDLSELTDMTGAIDASVDEIIMLDNGAERRKRFSEIFGSNAYNSTTIPSISGLAPIASPTFTGNLTIPSKIIHAGDTDTYIQFHAGNQFRVVAGGAEVTEWRSDRMQMNGKSITWDNWDDFSETALSGFAYQTLNAPVYLPALNVGTTNKYLPFLQGSAQHTSGYRSSYVFGAYKRAVEDNGTSQAGWGDGHSGFFMGMGGSDAAPTTEFRFSWDGKIWHSGSGSGSTYIDYGDANVLKFIANSTQRMEITAGGTTFNDNVSIGGNQLENVGNAYFNEYLYHNGDTDTYIRIQDNSWTFRTGGDDRLIIDNTNLTVNANLDLKAESDTGSNSIHLPRGGHLSLYGNGSLDHSISSRNSAISAADDIRISSYGAVYINLDANSNNTSGADFVVARHNATGHLFKVDGETGAGTGIHSFPNSAADGVSLMSYAQGTVPINQGVVQIRSVGKTGWANGDELGSIDWYNNDGSGVGGRNLARIVAANSQGNGSSTTTFNGELHFYTSAYNAQLNAAPAMRLTENNSVVIGDGTDASSCLKIMPADDGASDDIQFYNGSTRIGEIGTQDTSWLRINQVTNKNIYTPRYIRADNGFFVDDTNKGINGSGNFIGGTITGASDANVSNWDTAYGWGNHASAGYTTNTGDVTSVSATAPLGVSDGGGPNPNITFSSASITTSTSNTDGDYFLVHSGTTSSGSLKKLTKANINISGFNNDSGFLTSHQSLSALLPKAGGTMSGQLTMNGQSISMGNGTITGANKITFNDPGVSEGLAWNGGNLWQIYESPDAQTNSAGNLQFTSGSGNGTKRFTITTDGYIGATRTYFAVDRSTGYFYNDSGTRTAYTGGDFYIKSDVSNCYLYATNTYLGATSGDTIRFRGNTVTADSWGITSGGDITISNKVIHNGDTNTYMSFSAADTWELYCGGYRMIKAVEASSGYDYLTFGQGASGSNTGEFHLNMSSGDFHADGNVIAYSTTTSSDRKLKKNIQSLEGSLEKVLDLRGVSFQWKRNDKESIGFIAQEVQEVVPEIVHNNRIEEDGVLKSESLGVDYGNITALLVEAVKEQQALINRLEERIKTLESKTEK